MKCCLFVGLFLQVAGVGEKRDLINAIAVFFEDGDCRVSELRFLRIILDQNL